MDALLPLSRGHGHARGEEAVPRRAEGGLEQGCHGMMSMHSIDEL